jgi:hypothetical protein
MPASRKPDLIPADAIPQSPAQDRGAWTVSFEVEEDPADATTSTTPPRPLDDSKVIRRPLEDSKVSRRPLGPQEDSKVTRRPLAGRPNSDSTNATRPLAQTRGT